MTNLQLDRVDGDQVLDLFGLVFRFKIFLDALGLGRGGRFPPRKRERGQGEGREWQHRQPRQQRQRAQHGRRVAQHARLAKHLLAD